jgi:hypothetical protein
MRFTYKKLNGADIRRGGLGVEAAVEYDLWVDLIDGESMRIQDLVGSLQGRGISVLHNIC